jgi:hypothetical protein
MDSVFSVRDSLGSRRTNCRIHALSERVEEQNRMNYQKINITVSPKLFPGTLLLKSVCDCGMPVLKDDVPIGKEYVCDLNSVRWARWRCDGCGKVTDIRLIDVHSPMAFVPIQWFLLDMLDLDAGIPRSPKPLAWEPVKDGKVSPKGISDRMIVSRN